eukprot:SAG11_NODE_17379_length_520_cov_1.095012_2_plen_85_part_01
MRYGGVESSNVIGDDESARWDAVERVEQVEVDRVGVACEDVELLHEGLHEGSDELRQWRGDPALIACDRAILRRVLVHLDGDAEV